MHVNALLHKVFQSTSQRIDKRLHRTLLEAACTLSDCRHLSIAELGRCLLSQTAVKHTIKRIDRLFGNPHLHFRRRHYYQTMVKLLIGMRPRPVILIDWSGLTRCGEYHFLRASVPVGGRALVIWESTYREKAYMSQAAHRTFIQELKALLPRDCRPVIVTDAGFRCPWFKLTRKQGWDFIGRARHNTKCCQAGTTAWIAVKRLHGQARRAARLLFSGLLAKDNPVVCHFYAYRGAKQRRVSKNLRGKKIQCSVSLKHAKREREPWLIVSSLPIETYTAAQIISIYKKRMQIEEAFRDLKNTRNGFSLRHCRSFDTERLNVALLIAAITMLLLWVVGIMAKREQHHRLFQANTVRDRNVLSVFTIGWQSLKRKQRVYATAFFEALKTLQNTAQLSYVEA